MIDIRSHILPGMDDGPKILKDTIQMAEAATQQGIHTIIATPNYNETFTNTREDIIGATEYVNSKLQEQGIQLHLLPGQEIHIYEDIVDDLKRGLLLTLNKTTPYVLIRLPESNLPSYTTQLVFDMQIAGYIPILASPERNNLIADYPNSLYDIVKNGALIQVDAASVIGQNGKKATKTTQQLLEANMAHFIASNAYDTRKKGFHLQKAYKQVGEYHANLFRENSELLIHGKGIIKDAPERIVNKGFWGFLK